jgi:23S rRNA (pseudouridine1915-N3)-methyltransferase
VKLKLLAIGRMKAGPEADLFADYKKRFDSAAPHLGLAALEVKELELNKRLEGEERKRLEGELLLGEIPPGALVVALDERGKTLTSKGFSTLVAEKRDEGLPQLVFIIGGADGLSGAVRARADKLLSFSPMTWPHMLVRVMVMEQLYRSASILAGHPYHKA